MISGHFTIEKLLQGMRKVNASDLHIKSGLVPCYRIGGLLKPLNAEPLSPDEADHLLDPIIPPHLRERFEKTGDLDFSTYLSDGDRFRVNMFRAGGHVAAAIRRVRAEIPTYANLHLPPIYNDIVERTNEGLVIVVGVTGSGKSSTIAAMIEHINTIRGDHIITVEDPVEFRFTPKKSIISQREIGIDVSDYKTALRYLVRQDPDTAFIGEMRDHDTVLAALQAAETGHLVFASMHTADTSQSFARILEFFPTIEHGFIAAPYPARSRPCAPSASSQPSRTSRSRSSPPPRCCSTRPSSSRRSAKAPTTTSPPSSTPRPARACDPSPSRSLNWSTKTGSPSARPWNTRPTAKPSNPCSKASRSSPRPSWARSAVELGRRFGNA